MIRSKVIKKRTKNRLTLLKNLRKGKARLEPRCGFQLIPPPLKYEHPTNIHHINADVVLMEQNGTIATELSLLNYFKLFKQVQVTDLYGQKVAKVLVEDKNYEQTPWQDLVEKFEKSNSGHIRRWAEPIRSFCERYKNLTNDLANFEYHGISHERASQYKEMNDITNSSRQKFMKNYPCAEIKSQYKNGKIQVTEVSYNEKFLSDIGFNMETFTASVIQEGLPRFVPFESPCPSFIAKNQLDNLLIVSKEGLQSEEIETSLIMKSGYMKKVKVKFHYHCSYEKGVFGFNMFVTTVAKQKPGTDSTKYLGNKLDKDFLSGMTTKEQEMSEFLSLYYKDDFEHIYNAMHKTCLIKEIETLID